MPIVSAKDVSEMPERNTQNGAKPQEIPEGITKITVGGYKSIAQEQSIEIRPLTILAGANSSGKSSIMQPLLLLKQTLEASYEPEALLLDGPNVHVASAEQILSEVAEVRSTTLVAGLEVNSTATITTSVMGKGLKAHRMTRQDNSGISVYVPDAQSGYVPSEMPNQLKGFLSAMKFGSDTHPEWQVSRDRCFLQITLTIKNGNGSVVARFDLKPTFDVDPHILETIHLPGLRGKPVRVYPATAVGPMFPGTFDDYAASLVAHWQIVEHRELLVLLERQLFMLGLTSNVVAKFISDTQVVLRVGRTLGSGTGDTVSIVDVGLGVSQTLPVLVALLAAKPGQLVYLEQPEIHLHPRAQTAMAQVLADAAMRGVRVVAETHSSLLLLGIQTLVAEGKLPPELVKLHWFTRGDDGATTIRSADLDESGAFGDWPEDFDDVALDAQSRYLDAAEQRMVGK